MAKKSNDTQPASASSQEKALQLAVTNCDRFKSLKHSNVAPYAFTLMQDITTADILNKIQDTTNL